MARNPAQHPAAEQPGTLNSKERQKNKLRRPKAESTSHRHHLLTSSTGKLPALIWAEVILLINLSGTFIDAKERAWHLSSFHDAQETVKASKVQRFSYFFIIFFPPQDSIQAVGTVSLQVPANIWLFSGTELCLMWIISPRRNFQLPPGSLST